MLTNNNLAEKANISCLHDSRLNTTLKERKTGVAVCLFDAESVSEQQIYVRVQKEPEIFSQKKKWNDMRSCFQSTVRGKTGNVTLPMSSGVYFQNKSSIRVKCSFYR